MMKKILIPALVLVTPLVTMGGCSTNPATGAQQFTALMSPSQENQVGASEHEKIAKQFGFYENAQVSAYVSEIGRKLAANTERPDVQYKFYVLDDPIVNAFALPGGYVYISRGLLALANNEAEVAAVVGHEIGHITGRHSAERYSRAVVTSLGANILSIAIDKSGVSQALDLGANLYLSSYSRNQETEADTLGLRYMTRGGYDADAMPEFLSSLQAQSGLEARIDGKQQGFSYLSTHPATADRVNAAVTQVAQYPDGGAVGAERHINVINGMTYGDSAKQGFVIGQNFYHPDMGFMFSVPQGYKIINQPSAVAATSSSGAAIVFDMASNTGRHDPATYLQQIWMKGEPVQALENITVGGMQASTAMFSGQVNGVPATIRLMAIAYAPDRLARFQIAIPQRASASEVDALKVASYSFRRLSAQEKLELKPKRIAVVTAQAGDTIATMAQRMAMDSHREEHFMVLNALLPNQALKAGQKYKIVTQ